MNSKNFYILAILAHIGLGLLLFFFKPVGFLIAISIFLYGSFIINKNKDKNNEALLFSSYVVGAEVLLRMTGTSVFNEFAKYVVIIFLFYGIVHKGFSKKAIIYVFFILLFVPGIYIGIQNLNFDTNIRKAIAFNISGPITLAVASIYCYGKEMSLNQLKSVFIALGLPIVSILTYVIFYSPSVKDVVTGTHSNFVTSGGFGPNQISTILGLGILVFFVLFLLYSKPSKRLLFLNFLIVIFMAYRAIVTFSRGGVYTGLTSSFVLLLFLYFYSNSKVKYILFRVLTLVFFIGILVWSYSAIQTNGMIQNRYQNKDALGRVKQDKLGGREKIAETEIQMFLENPLLGIGIGKNKEYREEMTGIVAASHNELTRMLAEQGLLGVLGLLLLLLVPILHFFENKENIFLFSFYLFWLLTINHAAMRIAAPAFIYALSLLKVTFTNETKTPIHR